MAAAKKTAASKTTSTKAAEAQEKEAVNEGPTSLEFKGVEYEVPSQLDMPFEVLKAIRTGDEIEILSAILGPEQWAAFEESRPTIREFQDFAEMVAEAAGFGDEGN